MGDRQPAKTELIEQRIDEDFHGDFNQFPSQVKNFFTKNLIYRALSQLMGTTEQGKAIILRATNSGILKTANVGSGIESVGVLSGTATATETPTFISTPNTSNKVVFIARDYDLFVRTSPDGVTFGDQIFIKGGTEKQLDLVCKAVKVQRVGANDAVYRLEFYR